MRFVTVVSTMDAVPCCSLRDVRVCGDTAACVRCGSSHVVFAQAMETHAHARDWSDFSTEHRRRRRRARDVDARRRRRTESRVSALDVLEMHIIERCNATQPPAPCLTIPVAERVLSKWEALEATWRITRARLEAEAAAAPCTGTPTS